MFSNLLPKHEVLLNRFYKNVGKDECHYLFFTVKIFITKTPLIIKTSIKHLTLCTLKCFPMGVKEVVYDRDCTQAFSCSNSYAKSALHKVAFNVCVFVLLTRWIYFKNKMMSTYKYWMFKGSRMGPFSGDFQRGGDSERNIPYFSALYRPYTACIIARLLYGSQQCWKNEMSSTVRYDSCPFHFHLL